MKIPSLLLILGLLAGSAHAGEQTPEEILAKITKDFAEIQLKKDPSAIDRVTAVIADDFIYYDPSYNATAVLKLTKKQFIDGIKNKDVVVNSMTFPPFYIRVFGSTAVVHGSNDSTITYKGKDIGGKYVWFDVFEKRAGRWVWIVSQSSKVGNTIASEMQCDDSICGASQPGFSFKQ